MKYAAHYVSILSVVLALVLTSTFYGVERAWADSLIKTIPVGNAPFGIAFNPSNNDIYVTNRFSNTVSVIATTTPIQTTISSATDSNGNPVQDGSGINLNGGVFERRDGYG